ncbi:sensor histidine kinase [Fibrella aquatilis]|uniref:Histidine kinase n=1 Tax=Fibrella aquatilis TaxID=2817059 RepID=A0A939G6N0_9BACT|nr:histidine kinase [Fibrella aquatilis]MBO0933154.1 histidine kinase [Fibrella aquatilis]
MTHVFAILRQFHQRHRGLTHGLFWALVLLTGSMDHYARDYGQTDSLGISLQIEATFLLPRIAIAYLTVYGLLPQLFRPAPIGQALGWLVLGLVALYGIYLANIGWQWAVSRQLSRSFNSFQTLADVLNQPRMFYKSFLLSNFGGAGGLLLIRLLVHQGDVWQQSLVLEKEKTALELKLLKTQLNPHFLFNTLNNLYALALLQSPHTPAAIARLADMLDYMLYRCNAQLVPLAGEVTLLNNYIALERLRYDDTLHLTCHLSHAPDVEIAPLLLLSLVENAFKHGAGEATHQPIIDIRLTAQPGNIQFRVANSCTPQHLTAGGLGLPNIRQQLALLYPNRHTMMLNEHDGLFVVDLTLT